MAGTGSTRRAAVVVALLAVAALVVAGPAGAMHWPNGGGDAGRSGFQPVDEGGLPITFKWQRADHALAPRSSMLTSAGSLADQRSMYATDEGRVVVRRLLTGSQIGGLPDLSAKRSGAFGTGAGNVTPVETSTSAGLGQVFAVFNQGYNPNAAGDPTRFGVELGQVDETAGDLVAAPYRLSATDPCTANCWTDYTINSSPVITPPDGAGNRVLFFLAEKNIPSPDPTNHPELAQSLQTLYRVPIANASSRDAAIGTVTYVADTDANPLSSPTLVWLNDAGGTPTAYVALGTFQGIKTYSVADLTPGPESPAPGSNDGLAAGVRTPSTPVTITGEAPGAPGSGMTTTPAIYAASTDATSTRVHKFTQTGSSQVLDRADSPAVSGEAAVMLATDQVVSSSSTPAGHLFVTTSTNLYSFRTDTLALAAAYSGADLPAGQGFRYTTAAATGQLVAVVTDGGAQLVLDATTLAPVDNELFRPAPDAWAATEAFGQPAVSSRFLQMGSGAGAFVYGMRLASPPTGYWLAASDGGIFAFGDAGFFGSTGNMTLNRPIVGMGTTPTREGYWLVASDGGVFSFGDAVFHGSAGDITLNSPIIAMAPTPSGDGYWMVAADGGVFSFGDAEFFGSTGDLQLNKPIVGIAPTITGLGYWLVASDGGIFAFGDAAFFGSTGGMTLNKPIVGMAANPNGDGYWLVGSDGGIFAFGRSGFYGSTGDITLNKPIITMAASGTGLGYVFTAPDGGVFSFGDVPFLGSTGDMTLNKPIVALAVKP
ncbi:MAG TPA: hypothetical protein VHN98_01625 [Acidimicrobiales bacterium]|nr:hypothetical protein [Acidimicrobiales bacterium]